MDNAAFHKQSLIKNTLESNGCLLEYLPPYSPDLNPIERKWAQAKSIRKKYMCDIPSIFKYI